MEELNIKFFQKELERINSWIKFSDRRAFSIAAHFIASTGIFFLMRNSIEEKLSSFQNFSLFAFYLILVVIVIFLAIGFVYLMKAIFTSHNEFDVGSPVFNFKNKFSDAVKEVKVSSEKKINKQILKRVYDDSIVANKKIAMTQVSMKFLFIAEIILVLLALIIL